LLYRRARGGRLKGGGTDLAKAVDEVISCRGFDDLIYCTEIGFVPFTKDSVGWTDYMDRALAGVSSDTGDMSLADLVVWLEGLSPSELAERQAAQFDSAELAVGRLAAADAMAAPERRAGSKDRSGAAPPTVVDPGGGGSPPDSRQIMSGYFVEQTTDFYCGPATMDSIDWADDGYQNGQSFWAGSGYLNTDQQGATAIADMVAVTNSVTTWDSAAHGGTYAMVSVVGKTKNWFMTQHELRIGVYGAPVIEHVMLWNDFFFYISQDHGGHFQTGKGYNSTAATISIFDPYDERDWVTGGSHSSGPHAVALQDLWDATTAHAQKNFGV
jgi:hypothetical protein